MKRGKIIPLILVAFIFAIGGVGYQVFASSLPTIIKTSNTVKPGETIGIYGADFGTNTQVKMKGLTGFTGSLSPDSADIAVDVCNSQDSLIQGVTPVNAPRDLYALWVGTDAGWSKAAFINRAEAFNVSEAVVYPGQELRVFGRNFLNPTTETAFGTVVNLVSLSDNNTIAATVKGATDNTVDIIVPATVEVGQAYTISISNGAGGEYGLSKMEDDQAFKVAASNENIDSIGNDFGVRGAWAATIPSKVFNVKDGGATGDGTTDDTAAVQNVLKEVGVEGGRVYFPTGTYCMGRLSLPNNVIMYGDGKSTSILKLIDDGAGTGMKFIDTSSVAGGIANLSLISEVKRPASDTSRRTGGYVIGLRLSGSRPGTSGGFFLKNVIVNIADGSGIYSDSTSTYLIVENSDFKVSHSNIMDYYARTRILNNTFYNTQRPALFIGGSNGYNWIEGNHIDALHAGAGREPGTNDSEHRIMDLGCLNNYIANNIVTGEYGATSPNADNSGEGILFQASRRTGYGSVISSTENTITVQEGSIAPDIPEKKVTGMKVGDFVAIVDGRGIGQIRKITGFTTNSITVDKPWDVLPDDTSIFTADYRVIYHNIMVGNNIDAKTKKGGICLYTKNYDNIITNNTMNNTGGIWLGQSQVLDQYRADFSYFTYVYKNTITGASDPRAEKDGVPVGHGKGNCVVIGIAVDGGAVTSLDKIMPSVGVYGNEYRKNSLTGIGTDVTPINAFNANFVNNSGILISTSDAVDGHFVSRGVIVERNKVTNTMAGVHMKSGTSDTLLYGNDFSGNKVDIDDSSSTRTIVVNSVPAEVAFTPIPLTPSASYVDIQTHWAKNDIEYAVSKGVVKGIDETHFAPEQNITRAEFLALVVRVLELDAVAYANAYSDVNAENWYAGIVQAAYNAKLIDNGMVTNNAFNPEASITREEMTSIIILAYNYAKGEKASTGSIDKFTDKSNISSWAEQYVGSANEAGIIKGATESEFSPKANATRAEAIVIIKRLMDKL